jgi:hypothetical protein
MTLNRFTAVNKIDIWQPRWKDRKVVIARKGWGFGELY